MGGAAAYFDLDRTLLAVSSERRLFSRLVKRKGVLWRTRALLRQSLCAVGRMLRGHVPYDAMRSHCYLKGVSADDLEQIVEELVDEELIRKIPLAARERLEWHRERGDRIVIVSATLQPIAQRLGEHLGVDAIHAVELPRNAKNRFTGSERGGRIPRRRGKVSIVQDDATKHDIDLAASWGYGNSAADAWFMRLCGEAMAVNPDGRLRKEAIARGWSVSVWEIE
ncbi:MAG TPA: HAD-IB family hydrolase [Candidatus Poseidoniales archaeon]|nr:HAD-IB family hydrolase [Candidatus Poseidoniales archaeon]